MPLVLTNPTKEKPLVVCITSVDHWLDALLAQKNVDKEENALYNLRWTLVGLEERYSILEKENALFVIQRLRHYL